MARKVYPGISALAADEGPRKGGARAPAQSVLRERRRHLGVDARATP